jgi:hypothetical protein
MLAVGTGENALLPREKTYFCCHREKNPFSVAIEIMLPL